MIAEIEARGFKLEIRSTTGELDLLRTAGGIVEDRDRPRQRAARRRFEFHRERATRSRCNTGPASVRLRKGTGQRNLGYGQSSIAGVGESNRLGRAGDSNGLIAEVDAGGGKLNDGSLHDLAQHRRSAGAEIGISAISRGDALRLRRERNKITL